MDDLKIMYVMSERIGRLLEVAVSTNELAKITGAKPGGFDVCRSVNRMEGDL